MSFDGGLFLGLLGLLGAMQAACVLLARGLGRRLEWHVIALGMALPLVFLFPWLDRGRLLVPADILQEMIPGAPRVEATHRHDLLNDAVLQFLPWELEVRHALSARRLPFWSDMLEGGSSPWINPQASPVSPIAMPARALPIQYHLLVTLALKILVAFEGAWLLARTVGLSRPSSLLAAAGFSLSGGMMAWALFPHSAVLAWVPWLAAAAVRLFRQQENQSRLCATAALLTAALLLSGHPETAAAGGLFAAVCGLSLARRRNLLRGLGAAVLAAVLGFGLAAPHILPFALHLPHSQRAQEALTKAMPQYFFHLQRPWSWFLPGFGQLVLSPVNPRVFGRPYLDEFRGPFNWVDSESGYAGLVAFAGAVVALLATSRRRQRRAWPFVAFAGASLLLAAQFLPLAHGIYAVAALKSFAWSRLLPVGCLALAVAGGMGTDRLLRAGRPTTAWIALAVAAVLSLAAHADLYVIALWSAIGAAAILGWKRRAWGVAGLGLALVLDLGAWAPNHLPSTDPALFYPKTAFLTSLQGEVERGGPWRVAGMGQMLFPSLLSVYGMAEVRTHNPLAPMSYLRTLDAAFGFAPSTQNYFPSVRNLDRPFLDFLNVRAVASVESYSTPRTLERIDGGHFGPYRLYRNPDALPRWFLPSAVEVIQEGELERWIAELKDPRRVAVFDGRARSWVGERGEVIAAFQSPGRILLHLPSTPGRRDRLVATSLTAPRGWRASGGGRRLETIVVNGAFLGVRVPAGVSRIDLRFRPPGFLAGLLLGLTALAMTAGLAVIACVAWRRK